MHAFDNKLTPHHKQIANKEEIYQAVGREELIFNTSVIRVQLPITREFHFINFC